MSQGEEFETRPAKRPRLLNPGSDARSSVGSIAPGTVSSSATTLVPGPKAKAKGKAKGKTIAKQWERSVAVHEATQTVEKLFKDMEETLQTAKNDLASARELAFGKDEDPVKLEQFRPYEMVVTRKCAWLAYIEAGIGLEHARAVAVEGRINRRRSSCKLGLCLLSCRDQAIHRKCHCTGDWPSGDLRCRDQGQS